jgi:hypothetical protein
VAGELADHGGVGAGVGEVGAEGVAQNVRGAAVVGQAGGRGVPGDDAGDVTGAQRAGLGGAGEGEQEVFGRGGRAAFDPGGDRREGVFVQRDVAGAAALP